MPNRFYPYSAHMILGVCSERYFAAPEVTEFSRNLCDAACSGKASNRFSAKDSLPTLEVIAAITPQQDAGCSSIALQESSRIFEFVEVDAYQRKKCTEGA